MVNSYLNLLETELFREGQGSISVYGNLATGWLIKLSWPKDCPDDNITDEVHVIFARGSNYDEAMKEAYKAYIEKKVI